MDLTKTIEELLREKEKLERVIASLEELHGNVTDGVPQPKRQGRKFMSLEERREVSARMTRYWKDRRNQHRERS